MVVFLCPYFCPCKTAGFCIFNAQLFNSEMKTVLLIRHSKSSWADPGMIDFERQLNDRGLKDAPLMAERLLLNQVKIDTMICSSAKRARQTCEAFASVYQFPPDQIQFKMELYLAPPERFYKLLKALPATVNHVALFAHNPGITEFANELSSAKIDDMPTCSVFAIKANISDWSNFEKAKKEFWFFDSPKKI